MALLTFFSTDDTKLIMQKIVSWTPCQYRWTISSQQLWNPGKKRKRKE